MRHVQVRVPTPTVERVRAMAARHGAEDPPVVRLEQEAQRMLLVSLPNTNVGAFVQEVAQSVDDADFLLLPWGVIPMHTPLANVQEDVRRVVHLSTLELVLSSLQSIGTWRGMLLYACFSGLVAAYGVIYSTSYLLTAAMLIAPMGAPAMVCTVAVAIGDWPMFRRGFVRFFAAIGLLVLTALGLGLLMGVSTSTAMMEQVTSLSRWSVLLALVGGAAGAQSQVQSDRDSLVSGTATGFLIAVALSPTSAVLGLGLVLGRWEYVGLMAFVVVLTLFGIITGGWVTLRIHDVSPDAVTASRASKRARTAMLAGAALVVAGLVAWQTTQAPTYLKADLSRQALRHVKEAVAEVPAAYLVETTTSHFTRGALERYPGEGMLMQVTVEEAAGTAPGADVEQAVRAAIEDRLRRAYPGVVPFVDVSVLPPSSGITGPTAP